LPGGQSLGKAAVVKSLATAADSGADADLSGRPDTLARNEFAGYGGQAAEDGEAQSVAQKLAATGAGIRRMSVHASAISDNICDFSTTG
jgi:hypothetical protein